MFLSLYHLLLLGELTSQQVHHALTSTLTWTNNSPTFNYASWYEQILSYFDQMPACKVQAILDWYQ